LLPTVPPTHFPIVFHPPHRMSEVLPEDAKTLLRRNDTALPSVVRRYERRGGATDWLCQGGPCLYHAYPHKSNHYWIRTKDGKVVGHGCYADNSETSCKGGKYVSRNVLAVRGESGFKPVLPPVAEKRWWPCDPQVEKGMRILLKKRNKVLVVRGYHECMVRDVEEGETEFDAELWDISKGRTEDGCPFVGVGGWYHNLVELCHKCIIGGLSDP